MPVASHAQKKRPVNPTWEKVKNVFMGIGGIFHAIGSCVYKLRKFLMSLPVLWGLVYLTLKNSRELPAQVGVGLQPSGEFALTISKEFALIGPVAVTVGCLLMMFASKKTLQPWVVSIFTLTLPILIWVINIFPG